MSIEFNGTGGLDDDSLSFLARVSDAGLLDATEWQQVSVYLRDAQDFLRRPQQTATRGADGVLVIDPDADPRNANWLRIAYAHRLAGHVLPMWASLWLWRIKGDKSKKFWRSLGEVAEGMGYKRWSTE